MKLKKSIMQVFVVGLILRLVPVLMTRQLGIGLDDMFQYDMLARSLASGNGYRWYAYEDLRMLEPYVHFDLSDVEYDPARGAPTSFRAPLYPTFLALVYLVSGAGAGRFFAARLAQAGLGALLAPLTYIAARRLFPERAPTAKIAAWIVACYPLLLIYPLGLATENLFFLLLLAAFYFLLRLDESSSLPITGWGAPPCFTALCSGLFLALAALTRSVILPFAGFAVLWAWVVLKQKRAAIVMGLTILVFLTPWVIRNSLLHHKLTGIESSMGYNLYVGYHPQSNGSFTFGVSLDLIPILDDAERDQTGTQRALAFIREKPERLLPLALHRLGYFFGLEKRVLMYFYSNNLLGYIPQPGLLALASLFLMPFVLLAPASALGLGVTSINPRMILLYLLLLAYLAPHVFILAEDRFHLSILPYLATLAAQAWSGGFKAFSDRWQSSRTGKLALLLSALAAVLLFYNWGLELARDADRIAALLGPNGNQTGFPY